MTDEQKQRRKLPFSFVSIPFCLVWTGILLTMAYFEVRFDYPLLAMLVCYMAMFASGYYLVYRTGGLSRK